METTPAGNLPQEASAHQAEASALQPAAAPPVHASPVASVPFEHRSRSAVATLEEIQDPTPTKSTLGTGGDEIRDHDFPLPPENQRQANRPVQRHQHQADPQLLHAGGKIGAVLGDHQKVGVVGSIMDQDEATPAFAQER